MTIIELFDMAWMGHMQWDGLRNLRVYATAPKLSANARVMRHFMKHQRQMQNAAKSGIGDRETARRRGEK